MRLFSQINPDLVFKQAHSRKFVMNQPLNRPKNKHLIMIAVAAAVESTLYTTTFMKEAKIAGVNKVEIAKAIMKN